MLGKYSLLLIRSEIFFCKVMVDDDDAGSIISPGGISTTVVVPLLCRLPFIVPVTRYSACENA